MTVRWIAQLVGLAVSALAIWLVLREVDLGETSAVLGRAALLPLAGSLVALALQFTALSLRWQMLLPATADGRPVPYRAVAEALLVGILANAALPARLGEVARTVVVARRGVVDVAGSAGTVVLERLLDLTMLATAALVGAYVAGAPSLLSQSLAIVAVGGVLAIAMLMTGVVPRLVARMPEHLLHRPRRHAAVQWMARLVHGVHAGRRPRVLALGLLATATSVLLDGAIMWLAGVSLGIELTWAQALLLATAGVLVTAVPSAPANIGTYELAVSWVATSLGVPTEAGLALAVVAHVIIVLPLSLAGAVVVLLSMRSAARGDDRAASPSTRPTESAGANEASIASHREGR